MFVIVFDVSLYIIMIVIVAAVAILLSFLVIITMAYC